MELHPWKTAWNWKTDLFYHKTKITYSTDLAAVILFQKMPQTSIISIVDNHAPCPACLISMILIFTVVNCEENQTVQDPYHQGRSEVLTDQTMMISLRISQYLVMPRQKGSVKAEAREWGLMCLWQVEGESLLQRCGLQKLKLKLMLPTCQAEIEPRLCLFSGLSAPWSLYSAGKLH